jgi:ATP-dependent RNA helicase DeaD
MLSDFENLGLDENLLRSIEKLGFETPTPIQLQAIPALLAGRDLMGQAQTGTGKTAAFVLPLLQKMQRGTHVQALILAPTRELAIQVTKAASQMAQEKSIRVMTVYGGQAYNLQIRQLKAGVDLVVGTTGRVMDLIRKNLLDISQVHYLILDEADEMLEMGFLEDVESILKGIPAGRQTALFSATLPKEIRRLADQYLNDPIEITIESKQRTVSETDQRYCLVRQDNKPAALVNLLEMEDISGALVFTRTRASAQKLADDLKGRGYAAEALHGDMDQTKREKVLGAFRKHFINIVVATDVAARGLDIQGLSHVFNYDAPNDADDYLHRVGRTGRAGGKGIAITLFTPRERGLLRNIESYTRQPMTELPMPTKEAVIDRREERFMQRLLTALNTNAPKRDRDLVARLAESPFTIEEIAAAAISMARSAEKEIALPTAPEPVHVDSREFSPKKKGYPRSDKAIAPYSFKKKEHRKGQRREEGMVRLQMNLGSADGIHPNDVVGAIAGETGINSRSIGKIDIFDRHAFVDVSERDMRQILQASDGKYKLRGKSVRLKLAAKS